MFKQWALRNGFYCASCGLGDSDFDVGPRSTTLPYILPQCLRRTAVSFNLAPSSFGGLVL